MKTESTLPSVQVGDLSDESVYPCGFSIGITERSVEIICYHIKHDDNFCELYIAFTIDHIDKIVCVTIVLSWTSVKYYKLVVLLFVVFLHYQVIKSNLYVRNFQCIIVFKIDHIKIWLFIDTKRYLIYNILHFS